jgi:drug/metabolite transporter (DMT)-like permease
MMSALAGVAALIGVALGGVANDRYGARSVQAITLPLMAFGFAGLSIAALIFSRFHKCETPTPALRVDVLNQSKPCAQSHRQACRC